ncbi:MAG: hypothetical protein J6T40_06120 [Clostridiales bacterium]|nr:hypothetical protein [Clostridiales bacterium]
MKKKRVRIISVLISVMLVLGNAGAMVLADDGDPQEPLTFAYRSSSYEELVTITNYVKLSDTMPTSLTEEWYYLDQDLTYSEPITVDGSKGLSRVNLILGDDCTLTAEEGIVINFPQFNIYTESDDSGAIIATSSDKAGIAFGTSAPSYATLELTGGTIEATGAEYCAGIGGSYGGPAGYIQIDGGEIEAYGGDYAAGIGSGYEPSSLGSVIMYGGAIYAEGGLDGAGIGGGKDCACQTLVISGAEVEALGNGKAPGIGAYGSLSTMHIDRYSDITAEGGSDGGAGIGLAAGSGCGVINGFNIIEAYIDATGGAGAAGIGGGYGVALDTTVTISSKVDRDIVATAGQKSGCTTPAQAIGDGADAPAHESTSYGAKLTDIYSGVFDGDGNQVEKQYRQSTLRSPACEIRPCQHPNSIHYTPEGGHHNVVKECLYCEDAVSSYSQSHTFDPQTHMCVCGSKEYKVTVIGLDTSEWSMFTLGDDHYDYSAGNASATMYIYPDTLDREINVKSATYVDPEDGQTKEYTQWAFVTNHSFTDRIPISMWMPESDLTFEIAFMMNVSLDCNGGSGSMDEPDSMERGTEYTLPDCGFTAPAGMIFAGWKIGDSDEILPAGEKVTVDTDLTLVAQWVEANQATIKSGNVDFDGCIRLIFRMNFSPDLLSDSSLHVEVEKHDETTYVYLDDTSLVSQKNGDYYISLPVPIPEFADDVTIRVVDGTGATVKLVTSSGERLENDSFTYSVMTYAENKQNSEDEKMATLAKALYWYGVASQNYFGYDSGKSFVFDESIFPATIANRLQEFKYEKSGDRPDGVEKTTIKAYFESDNTLSITFYTDGSVPVSDYEIIVTDHDNPSNTVTANLLYGSRKVSVEVENIPAPELGKAYDFTISYGEKTYTITASPMTYALTSYQSPNVDRQHLGIAFFCYYAAAYDYFHGNGQI